MQIRVSDLQKTYRTVKQKSGIKYSVKSLFHREYAYKSAVKHINFFIDSGESVGFVGKNGAGKTTTLKMLSGIIHPTGGSIDIGGYIPFEKKYEFKTQISLVMGSKFHLWWDLPAMETFQLHKKIYDIPEKEYRRNLSGLVDMFQADKLVYMPVKNLSLGERMKMELIASLLHSPKVLFLDEPTIGLDYEAQSAIRNMLSQYNTINETTILMTSHYLADIELVSKRLILINEGEIVYDGDKDDLGSRITKDKVIEVTVSDNFVLPEAIRNMGDIKSESGRITITASDTVYREILGMLIHQENIINIETKKLNFSEIIDSALTSGGINL